MRSSIFDFHEQADLKTFNQLLNDADVFFSNRRPGYQERYGLTADELCLERLAHSEQSSFHAVLPNQNGNRKNCVNCMLKQIRKV